MRIKEKKETGRATKKILKRGKRWGWREKKNKKREKEERSKGREKEKKKKHYKKKEKKRNYSLKLVV